jgi:pantothenate kinase type III
MNSMGEGESLLALMTTTVVSMQMGFLYGFLGAVTEGLTAIAEEEEEVV